MYGHKFLPFFRLLFSNFSDIRTWDLHIMLLSVLQFRGNRLRKDYRLQLKCDGTRRRTGGEVKGKLANGVSSQYSGEWSV